MLDINTSTEALAFQKVSALGKALETIFQKAIDYRDSLKFEDQPKLVLQYCVKVLREDIKKVFKDNIGVVVENVICTKAFPSCDFAIEPLSNSNAMLQLRNRSYGLQGIGDTKAISTADQEIKEVLELCSALDTSTGKLSSSQYGDDNKNLFIVIWFDVAAGLLLDHFVDRELVEPLTAKELAAIYLHESGHFFSVVDRIRYAYFVEEQITTHLLTLTNRYDVSDVARAIDSNQSTMSKLVSNNKNLVNKLNNVTKICKVVQYLDDMKDTDTKPASRSAMIFACVSEVLKFVLSDLILNILEVLTVVFYPLGLAAAGIRNSDTPYSRTIKTSDTADSNRRIYFIEKDADEYTVRSGYGEYQISSLDKLNKMIVYIKTSRAVEPGNATLFKSINNNLAFINFLSQFYKDSIHVQASPLYEADIDRLTTLCRMSIGALKELPPEVRYEYMLKYENCVKNLEEFKKFAKSKPTIIRTTIDKFLYEKPAILIKSLLTDTLQIDYRKFQEQVDELINNKLYYYGNKFRSLIK